MITNIKKRIFDISITAGLSALIVIMGLTHIGFIPWFNGVSITIIHIPVIICVMICGLLPGLISGIIFGLFSLIVAATSPTGPLDTYFTNPLISILPRALFALATSLIFLGLKRIRRFPKTLNYIFSSFLGSLLNTVFVMASLIFAKAVTFEIALAVLISNGLLEAAASSIICTAVMSVKENLKRKKSKFSDYDLPKKKIDVEEEDISDFSE